MLVATQYEANGLYKSRRYTYKGGEWTGVVLADLDLVSRGADNRLLVA